MFFLSSDDIFSKLTFSKHSCRKTIRVSNISNLGYAQSLVEHNLGLNCLQRLSANTLWCESITHKLTVGCILSDLLFLDIQIVNIRIEIYCYCNVHFLSLMF